MPFLDNLKKLKEQRGLSYNEIAELSGVSLATVNRIFNGGTTNPGLDTIVPIVIALGGSLDELTGIKEGKSGSSLVEQAMANYAEILKGKDERIHDKNIELKIARRDRTILLCSLFGVLALVIVVLLIDFCNGHMGYIRY